MKRDIKWRRVRSCKDMLSREYHHSKGCGTLAARWSLRVEYPLLHLLVDRRIVILTGTIFSTTGDDIHRTR